MKIGQIQKKGSPLILLLGAIVIITALAVMFQPKEDILPVYTGSDPVSEASIQESSIVVESIEYKDEETGFTMPVPKDWTKVIKSGYPTYIHSPTKTSMQIVKTDYTPRINNDSIEGLTNSIQQSGYEVGEVKFFSSSAYYYSYYKQNSHGEYDVYCSFVMWDLEHIYSINVVVSETYYQQMLPYIQNSLTNVKWESKSNIPSDLNITYVEFGNFSFAYPVDWSIAANDNAIVVSENNNQGVITVKSTQNAVDYSKISQVQYSQYVSNGRQNFIMKQYANDGHTIHGEAVYYVNGVQYGIYQYLISTGTFEIEITLDCTMSAANQILPVFQKTMKYFHVHDNDGQEKKIVENSETSNIGNTSNTSTPETSQQVSDGSGFSAEVSQDSLFTSSSIPEISDFSKISENSVTEETSIENSDLQLSLPMFN